MADKPNPSDKLDELLGPHTKKIDALGDALKEIGEEQAEERKEAAKKLVREALTVQKELKAKEREFKSVTAKANKALGKIINRINAMAKGEPPAEDEDEDTTEE